LPNHELAEIDASMKAIVRRAYDLGRREALSRVVEVLNADRPSDQLALMAPEGSKPASSGYASSRPERSEPTPWWAWPVR
jgi:hypothetical protein